MNKRIYVFQINENWHTKLISIRTVSETMANWIMEKGYGKDNFLYLGSTFKDHITEKFMSNILTSRA